MKEIVVTPKIKKELEILGDQIRLARLRRGFSMALIAERAEISRPTLAKLEKGCPEVSIGVIAKVLQAIGNMDGDIKLIAKDDVAGRTFQDLELEVPKRSKRR